MKYSVIAAYDNTRGLGSKGSMAWYLPPDLKRFRDITKNHIVIMGRKTWLSLPDKFKPLPNRVNVILSSTMKIWQGPADVHICNSKESLDILLNDLHAIKPEREIFFIGGADIYSMAINQYSIDKYYLTEVYQDYECDVFFPQIPVDRYTLKNSQIHHEKDIIYRFMDYELKPKDELPKIHSECQYFDLAKKILTEGKYRKERTGVGTLSIFDQKLTFDNIDQEFPLLTSKRVFWRGVCKELTDLFLKGKSDAKILQTQGIKIWDGNSNRKYLDSIGQPDREEGDLGEFYGVQWKHWGVDYKDCKTDYTGQGFDQIEDVVKQIKNSPCSRRIIISAWNVAKLKNMCLPPCHVLYMFYVDTEQKTLSCTMFQRSADVFLGLPFNIASTALLTTFFAKTCDLRPKQISIQIGDAHIYVNHIKQMQEQITRVPYKFPTVEIKQSKSNVSDYEWEDIILKDYKCHGKLVGEMAA